jgi:hypothetical protein
MASIIFVPVLVLSIALQPATVGAPSQIGPTGARLTADDVAQITRIALAAGRPPWLLLGQSLSGPLRSPHPWPVAVFLAADHQGGAVARGRVLFVQAGLVSTDDYSTLKKWEVSSTGRWAQLPADPKRPTEVRSSRDLSRPFSITGSLEDRTIEDVVVSMRAADSRRIGVQATWPIVSMTADSDSKITVYLLRPNDELELSGQVVVLGKATTGWTVVSIAGWAV